MSVKIEGTPELIRKLKKFGADGEKMASDVAQASALDMQSKAEASIRRYSQTIQEFAGPVVVSPNVEGKKVYDVSMVNVPYAAYAEFGTGAYVDVEPGWEDVAMEFYVNGRGTLSPHPFFIPAFNDIKSKFIPNLEKGLKYLEDKFNGST